MATSREMIDAGSRPRLASKARLRYDRKAARYMLLYPERGLVLNTTAADIVHLCTGDHTVGGIVERLVEKYAGRSREDVEGEVLAFLAAMADRGLVKSEG